MTYKEFRKKSPIPSFFNMPLSSTLCYICSPFISKWCIKNGIKPNTVTLAMIITGIIGGIVLLIPNVWCKFAASFIYYLWFTLDLSDGEVARVTQTFSKGGKLLDWCAHLATHPLLIFGIWITFLQYYENNIMVLTSIVCMLLISFELVNRSLVTIYDLYFKLSDSIEYEGVSNYRKMIMYIKGQFAWFPNMVILLPFLFSLDILFSFHFFIYIFLAWAIVYSLYVVQKFYIFVIRLYKL